MRCPFEGSFLTEHCCLASAREDRCEGAQARAAELRQQEQARAAERGPFDGGAEERTVVSSTGAPVRIRFADLPRAERPRIEDAPRFVMSDHFLPLAEVAEFSITFRDGSKLRWHHDVDPPDPEPPAAGVIRMYADAA